MSRVAPLLGRAAVVTVAATLAQAVTATALGSAVDAPLPFVNMALLLGATTLLGAVWAMRSHLRHGSALAPVAAALVPVAASALFVLPRLLVGSRQPACLTVGVATLFAPGVERYWAHLLRPGASPLPAQRALRIAAPVVAVGLVVAGTDEGHWTLLLGIACFVGAGLVAAGARAAVRSVDAEAERFVTHLGRVEIRRDAIVVPPAPATLDPWLKEVDRRLRRRASEVADVAKQDARARRSIAGARALRTRFMASMSHELRSPLNSIVGFAQLLDQELEGKLTDGQRENVTMIRRSAEQLIRLLTDVLDLARLEAGKLTLRREWVPSVELLTEAVSRGHSLVEGRDVAIEAELQPGMPPVYVDRRRILQAVVALFRHAASGMKRTRIRLRARVAPGPPGPDPQLRLELYDAVGAIAPAEVARIFEAFREITEPKGRRVGGLGMALSLSRELLRLHGGDVWAESVAGAGTILCVALPIDETSR